MMYLTLLVHLRSMTSGVFCLAIRRSDVLQSAMFGMERIAFSPDKAIEVQCI